MNLKTLKSNTQAQSFTINSLCGIQSKAFDKSVNKASKFPLLSKLFFRFSIIGIRQYFVNQCLF